MPGVRYRSLAVSGVTAVARPLAPLSRLKKKNYISFVQPLSLGGKALILVGPVSEYFDEVN